MSFSQRVAWRICTGRLFQRNVRRPTVGVLYLLKLIENYALIVYKNLVLSFSLLNMLDFSTVFYGIQGPCF